MSETMKELPADRVPGGDTGGVLELVIYVCPYFQEAL
jgi:hypothetical protein